MHAIKTIKFDLPIDGVNVKTIEELREHFTVEILALHNNGILLKWLRARKNLEEVSRLEAIPVTLSQFSLLKTLCEIFTIDTDDMIIAAALGIQPEKMEKNFPEIKAQYRAIASVEVKSQIIDEVITDIKAKVRAEVELEINPPTISGIYKVYKNGTVTNTQTGLMWKQTIEGKYNWHNAMREFGKNVSFAGHNDWRIPTKEELETLIKNNSFLRDNDIMFWSVSSVADADHLAWGVNYFDYQYSDRHPKDNICKVRLVRSEC